MQRGQIVCALGLTGHTPVNILATKQGTVLKDMFKITVLLYMFKITVLLDISKITVLFIFVYNIKFHGALIYLDIFVMLAMLTGVFTNLKIFRILATFKKNIFVV